ncbi:unnamed protein product [Schistocephalus solidus]|uniref:Transposase n=1 Tax=Schistocephalus solidus TaxID=70667 RepID=A0A183S7I1_SCHSO|nr:unnamed protein product [Schistocephalus solidus]
MLVCRFTRRLTPDSATVVFDDVHRMLCRPGVKRVKKTGDEIGRRPAQCGLNPDKNTTIEDRGGSDPN